MVIDSRQYLELFIQEAEDLLGPLEDYLADWKIHPSDSRILEGLHRIAHTLKADSGLTGLKATQAFCRVLESAVSAVRSGKQAPSASYIDRISDAFRFLDQTVKTLKEERTEDVKALESLRESLEAFSSVTD